MNASVEKAINHQQGDEVSRDVTLVEAVNMALAREMENDDNVVVLGEDIATNGGVFRATVGLKERFGYKRVMDTPLAETLIAGTAVGMATQGLKPVAEFQFMGFIYAGLEQIPLAVASMPRSITARAPRPCSPTSPACGW